MIYFDNAATTFPKPKKVLLAVNDAITNYGGNPGRSGHKISLKTAQAVYNSRKLIADMFDAKPENTIFTLNCTHALNLAIKGVMHDDGHIIISSLEHNSVSRPVYALKKKGVSVSVAYIETDDDKTINNFKKLITDKTKVIVCTLASNVTGQITPYKRLAKLCNENNICFIADGAQACGVIDISMKDGMNILCTPGHKGLLGVTGTGVLITDGKYDIAPLMEGGTGATSEDLEQTPFLPEMLESGTINTVGAISLSAGVKFIKMKTMKQIFRHEEHLCNLFIKQIKDIDGIKIYRNNACRYVPIVSFNIKEISCVDVAMKLNDAGFALRSGLHCAIIAHECLGTQKTGTIRFAPGIFNTEQQVTKLALEIKKIAFNCKKYTCNK